MPERAGQVKTCRAACLFFQSPAAVDGVGATLRLLQSGRVDNALQAAHSRRVRRAHQLAEIRCRGDCSAQTDPDLVDQGPSGVRRALDLDPVAAAAAETHVECGPDFGPGDFLADLVEEEITNGTVVDQSGQIERVVVIFVGAACAKATLDAPSSNADTAARATNTRLKLDMEFPILKKLGVQSAPVHLSV